MLTTVPVIDIAPSIDGASARRAVGEAIDRACTEIGFFAIVGHGVSEALVAEMLETSRAFFDLPLSDKRRVAQPRPEQSRGYIGVGDENLSYSRGDVSSSDLKEFFAIGPVDVPDDEYHRAPDAYPSFAPNVWPERPRDFRDTWTRYYRALEALAFRLMSLFAVALSLSDDFFRPFVDRHISGLRANHYPEPTSRVAGQLRAGAHTDYGAVTILKAENLPGGLQVLNRRGEWVDVVAPERAFVCNIGDLMQRWTNDRWISTMHRVVNPPADAVGARRLSVPFFHQPNYDAVIECLPTCCTSDNPAKYLPVTSGEYRLSKFLKGVGVANTKEEGPVQRVRRVTP
jgi:isopenicillin N synthase-like dioxygenase